MPPLKHHYTTCQITEAQYTQLAMSKALARPALLHCIQYDVRTGQACPRRTTLTEGGTSSKQINSTHLSALFLPIDQGTCLVCHMSDIAGLRLSVTQSYAVCTLTETHVQADRDALPRSKALQGACCAPAVQRARQRLKVHCSCLQCKNRV